MSDTDRVRADLLSAVSQEQPNIHPLDERCPFCEDGLYAFEGVHVRPCVTCRPLSYMEWRLAGGPNLRLGGDR